MKKLVEIQTSQTTCMYIYRIDESLGGGDNQTNYTKKEADALVKNGEAEIVPYIGSYVEAHKIAESEA